MDEREAFKQELERELRLVKYRMKMLDMIEEKLLQMREIAEHVEEENITIEELNIKINNLAAQIKAIDGESRLAQDGKILE